MTDKTERRPLTRWYEDGPNLIGRMKDTPDECIPIASLPDHLRIEGYVAMRSKNTPHETIISTKPDRSLPNGKKNSELERWREAIALAAAEANTKTGFVGMTKGERANALYDGQAWADSLSAADVKANAKLATVIAAYGKLHGSKEPLVRKPALQDAAD